MERQKAGRNGGVQTVKDRVQEQKCEESDKTESETTVGMWNEKRREDGEQEESDRWGEG